MSKIDAEVYPLKDQPDNSTKAFASICFDDSIIIKGIRVVEGKNGHFVTMPQSKDKDGNYHDLVFPNNKELRQELNKAVLEKFSEVTKSAEKTAEKTTGKSAEKSTHAAPKKSEHDDLAV